MKNFSKKIILFIGIICFCIAVQNLVFTVFAENEDQETVYVGMDKCKTCHEKHVDAYSEWKYSKNFRILEMRGMDHSPECLPCHTTGYGKPGGFESVEETPYMKNIQCEACHGPASLHLNASTKEERRKTIHIPVNICTGCHRQHKHMGY